MQIYDFMAVSERMDESLVVLTLLHNFPDESIVVSSSKVGGGYDDRGVNHTCHKIQKSCRTEDVDQHLTDRFQGNIHFSFICCG